MSDVYCPGLLSVSGLVGMALVLYKVFFLWFYGRHSFFLFFVLGVLHLESFEKQKRG